MATQESSRTALYVAIEESTKTVKEDFHASDVPEALLKLSYAWRAVYGGAQPGTSVVAK